MNHSACFPTHSLREVNIHCEWTSQEQERRGGLESVAAAYNPDLSSVHG